MNGVWWCDNCQVPLLSPTCEACGSTYKRPFTKDLVPVFAEEIRLLRDTFGFHQLPKKGKDFLLWSSGTGYYFQGKRIATISYNGESISAPKLIMEDTDVSFRKSTRKSSVINDTFIAANISSIQNLEHETIEFIRNTVSHYDQHTPIVAFSGGKDSVVVSHLVRRAFGTTGILHVTADTTLEAEDTNQFLKEFQDINPRTPFIIASPMADFMKLCDLIGPPSRIVRWCCTSHKAMPITSIVGALRSGGNNVLAFDGVRAAESARRSKYARISKHHKIQGEVLVSPILNWKSIDIWAYILKNDLSFSIGYRKGFRRIGCLACPFNSRWSTFLIGHYYPDRHVAWTDFLSQFATRIGHPNPKNFSIEGWRTRAGGRGLDSDRAHLEKQKCAKEQSAFTYRLCTQASAQLLEYFKPFGRIVDKRDDGTILEARIVNPKSRDLIANIRVVQPDRSVRIEYANTKNQINLIQRFERQIKKYQSCVQCGSCVAACPALAIAVGNRLQINAKTCTHCMKCVISDCIAVASLTRKGKDTTWRICNGTD